MSDEWIVESLRSIVADLRESNGMSVDETEGYKWRIELMYRELLAKEIVQGYLEDNEKDAVGYLAQAYAEMSNYIDHLLSIGNSQSQPAEVTPVVMSGTRGRPSFFITLEQLRCLLDYRFSVPQIANLLGVSISTVRRRMASFNLSVRSTYSSITNNQLDEIVAGAQQHFPNWGNRQMYGHLISQNIRVPFRRVQESQRRVDPEGSVLRRLRNMRRRVYSVKGPQHLWHIDGNHKLIRYNLCS